MGKFIMSADIAWAITRNNSCYLLKKRNCPKPFSTDPMNLTNKGFNVTIKGGNGNKVAKSKSTVTMKAGPRRPLHKVKALINKQRYRKDLGKAAMRKAAAIIRSQKPLPARKGTSAKKSD